MSSDTQVEVKAFVPRWLRQRLRSGWEEPTPRIQPLRAAVLFADIVGFSSLTRECSSKGEIGLEQLAVAVSDYLGRLIDSVTAAGGDIENTYGDGFLAFWPVEGDAISLAARKAWLCASELTTNFDRFQSSVGSEFRLRTAVLEGDVFAIKAGGAGGHWLFFLAGDCLSEVSDLLSKASPGGIAVSSSIQKTLGEAPQTTQASTANSRVDAPAQVAVREPSSISQMLPFLPRALRGIEGPLTEGWLAEFRLVSILFVRFPTLRCRDVGDLPSIQAVIARVQQIIDRYDGATLRASMNDKGPFLLCAFGLPQNSHENDPQRAQAAARDLHAQFRASDVATRCVVSEGVTYCGMVGGGIHHSYTAMGEAINRAAKLVATSDDAEVIIDRATDSVRSSSHRTTEHPTTPISYQTARLVGRQIELNWLAERIASHSDATVNRAIVITGEAGIGKTTLLQEMTRRAAGTVLSSTADPLVGNATPYAIWQTIFRTLFAGDGAMGSRELTEALRERLARQGEDASLVDLAAPILQLAPNSTDASRFNLADRARLTRTVLIALLRDRLATDPITLLLDDAHWMDAASWSLAGELVTRVPQALLILAARPSEDFEPRLTAVPHERLYLKPMLTDETKSLLAGTLNCREITTDVVNLVQRKAAGNPLFTTQLGLALLETQAVAVDNGRLRFGSRSNSAESSALSDTVQRVIVARVDRLPAPLQQTLKAASVVGDSFDANIVQSLIPGGDADTHLDRLTALGLLRRLPNDGASHFQFNHGMTREVMYRQMAFAHRRHLHQLAASTLELMETMPADAVLGHHWSSAEMADRALPYWERAGYTAFAAGAFAEAAASFDQAAACLSKAANIKARAARAARLYRHAGDALLQIGNIALSRRYLVQALAALGRKWPAGALPTLSALANEGARQVLLGVAPHRPQTPARQEADLEAAQVYETLGQVLGHTSELALMCLATLAALNTSQRCGHQQIYSRACGLLALVLLLIPLPTAARRYFRHSIDACPPRSEPHDWLMTTEYLALYNMSVANFEAAEAMLVEMLDLGRAANNRRRCLDAMSLLSITLMCKGELGRCAKSLAAFESEVQNERDPQVLCWVHLEQAELALMRGDAATALRQIEGCGDLVSNLGRNERLWADGLKALALWRLSRNDDALATASLVLEHSRTANEIAFYAQGGVFAAAEVYIEALRPDKVMARGTIGADARRMMRFLRKFGIRLPICLPRTLLLLGCYYLALGRRRKGLSLLHRAREVAGRQKRPYEEAVATIRSEAGQPVTSKADTAFQALRDMGAEELLGHLPITRSAS
ncbi:AAA family ATPase [Bradyrhizobium manausense]|uniref:AAA family ATPase n=1 Tax=Bradyrhizobium manausense TaxID=989370 RepID=UPI001BABCAB4|nr:AAA family ATPase [Bradyrhizobium manausense]MBR0829841.1 AAA family ATPase [Bradyrhizobium manausense]